MKILLDKKGSATVFISIILGSVFAAVILLAGLAKDVCLKSQNDALLSLSSKSVMSEYCIPLYNRYGIMAMDLSKEDIRNKFTFYIDGNISKKCDEVKVMTGSYCLNNMDNFEEQIVKYSKLLVGENLLVGKTESEESKKSAKILKNTMIKECLPSKNINGKGIDISGFSFDNLKIDSFFDRSKKSVLVCEYILSKFSNHRRDCGETFFANEVEYILGGNFSDSKNYTAVKNKILLIRNAVNLAYIESSAEMKAKITAASLAAGTGAEIAYLAILETWALAESYNDIKILEDGKLVPIVKTKDTWATDLQSVLENSEADYIDIQSETGMDYEDYLHVLLFLQDKSEKYARCMDLIQINMQGTYSRDFYIATAYTGFDYSVMIDRKKYENSEKYIK